MAPLRYTAKFDPFLSLDCAPTPSTLAQSKERKGSNFAIWQPWPQHRQRGHLLALRLGDLRLPLLRGLHGLHALQLEFEFPAKNSGEVVDGEPGHRLQEPAPAAGAAQAAEQAAERREIELEQCGKSPECEFATRATKGGVGCGGGAARASKQCCDGGRGGRGGGGRPAVSLGGRRQGSGTCIESMVACWTFLQNRLFLD